MIDELQKLIDSGLTRPEMVAALVERYGMSPAFARLIIDISLGVIDSDVIVRSGADELSPILPL